MDKPNGAQNGQETTSQKSPPAAGANSRSPKKRRKVNHGKSTKPRSIKIFFEASTDRGVYSCSLCVLSPICKSCIGSEYMGLLDLCTYAHIVWQKLIRSGISPAYDMRFGTTSFPIMQPLVLHSVL